MQKSAEYAKEFVKREASLAVELRSRRRSPTGM
jgi:hypothetical protein